MCVVYSGNNMPIVSPSSHKGSAKYSQGGGQVVQPPLVIKKSSLKYIAKPTAAQIINLSPGGVDGLKGVGSIVKNYSGAQGKKVYY